MALSTTPTLTQVNAVLCAPGSLSGCITNSGQSYTKQSEFASWDDTTPPGDPTSLVESNLYATAVRLDWNAPAGEKLDYYIIDRGGVDYVTTSNLYYNITGQDPGSTVNFHVRAVDCAGNESGTDKESVTFKRSPYSSSTSSSSTSGGACALTSMTTRWRETTIANINNPSIGDTIWDSEVGGAVLNGGNNWWSDPDNNYNIALEIDANGVVTDKVNC